MEPNRSVHDAAHNPYAPPRAEEAPASRPMPVMHGGSHAVIVLAAPLPPVCVKCGATSGVVVLPRHVVVHGGGPPDTTGEKPRSLRWAAIAIMLVVAALTVVDGRHTVPVVLAAAVVGGIVSHVRSRLLLELPLCTPCEKRWRAGVFARGVAVGGVLVGASLASLGMYAAGGLVIAAAVALLAVTKVAKRLVGAAHLSDGRVLLLGLAQASATAIVAAETSNVGASVRSAPVSAS